MRNERGSKTHIAQGTQGYHFPSSVPSVYKANMRKNFGRRSKGRSKSNQVSPHLTDSQTSSGPVVGTSEPLKQTNEAPAAHLTPAVASTIDPVSPNDPPTVSVLSPQEAETGTAAPFTTTIPLNPPVLESDVILNPPKGFRFRKSY